MTRRHAASSKVHLHSSVRFSPCPVASFGSKLPWTLPLAFHPTVASDAERDWRQPWILGWERLCSTQHKRPQIALTNSSAYFYLKLSPRRRPIILCSSLMALR